MKHDKIVFKSILRPLPKLTPIDKEILSLGQSTILNYAMTPIVGAVDTFWISKMNSETMLAGQGTADNMFGSIYSIASFAPCVVTPLVSKYHAFYNTEQLNKLITTSVFMVGCIGFTSSFFMYIYSKKILANIIPHTSKSFVYANEYFQLRVLSFGIALLNSLAFAILRGKKNLILPMKINFIAQIINLVLDPIFMKVMGVKGVALGTIVSEIYAFIRFYSHLFDTHIINISKFRKHVSLKIIKRAAGIQIRALCLSSTFMLGLKKVQMFDVTGSITSAHLLNIQLFETLFIVNYAMGLVSTILVQDIQTTIKLKKKYLWGSITSTLCAIIHLGLAPIFQTFSKSTSIITHAYQILPVAALFQFVCGFTSITEGISQGSENYRLITIGSCYSFAFFNLFILRVHSVLGFSCVLPML